MVFRHGRKTGIILGTTNLTQFLNESSVNSSVETAETTAYGEDSKTYIIGISDGTASLGGMFDGSEDAIDEVFSTVFGSNKTAPIFVQHGYSTSDGPNLGVTFAIGHLTSYEIGSPFGDVVTVAAEVNVEEGIYMGRTLHNPTGDTDPGFQNTAHSLGINNDGLDNTTSTSRGMRAQVHFITNTLSGGGAVLTIEDSPDNSTWSTLATFATAAAGVVSVEQITASGTVERYVRLNIDTTAASSGAVEVAVGFHRVISS
jgi:hypothetical protein